MSECVAQARWHGLYGGTPDEQKLVNAKALERLLRRVDDLEDMARAAITWATSSAKRDLTQRLEDALRDE